MKKRYSSKPDIDSIINVLVSMCNKHNLIISEYGYSQATFTETFQSVYTCCKFLNDIGYNVWLKKDWYNQTIEYLVINDCIFKIMYSENSKLEVLGNDAENY